jgi:bacillolysin
MKKNYTLGMLLSGISLFSYAQNDAKKENRDSDNGTATFVEFRDDSKKDAANAKQVIKNYLKASINHEFKVEKSETDKLGFTHTKHGQYFKGIKVEFGSYITHARNGLIETMNGDYKKIDDVFSVKPALTETLALNAALESIGADEYMWQTEDAADYYSKVKGKYLPTGELVIVENFQGNTKIEKTQPKLAWKFNIYATQPLSRANVYIDALNGQYIFSDAIIHHAAAPGTFATRYSGTQSATTDSYNGTFRLRDVSRGLGVETYNLKKKTRYIGAVDFTDANNQWTEYANATKDNAALDAHLGAQNTYDYFKNVHNRNSYNNAGAKILSYVHYSANYVNAFWDGSRMTYGDGNGTTFDPLTSQDVCSHELGHAVCASSANLVYQKESGAMNEALSDIWGACVEYYKFPTKGTWNIGEDFDITNHQGFRNMQNPNLFSDPDTYGGTFWVSQTCTPASANDYCGVHTNSGVLNFWFYLLTTGGAGTNDIGSIYNVAGIGIANAAKITYRMETVYMTSSTNYAGARTGAIQAATDLFGAASAQVIATTNAFYAVGIGAAYPIPAARIAAPTNLENIDITETTFNATWKTVETASEYEVEVWKNGQWGSFAKTTSNFVNIDNLPNGQTLAWRVIAKDKKGETGESVSKQIELLSENTLQEEGILSMKTYPNPSKEAILIDYKSKNDAEVQVQITDLMGRTYLQKATQVKAGENQLQFEIKNLPNGSYIIRTIQYSDNAQPKQHSKVLVIQE